MNVHTETEGTYKVGDMVRVKHTDYPDDIPVGAVVRVVEADEDGVSLEAKAFLDGLYFYTEEVEPATKFKIGDRVRATAGAPRGNVGTIRAHEPDDRECWLVEFDTWRNGHDGDGSIADDRGWWLAESEMELLPVAAATDSLRIEAGKYYRTRDDRKVGPISRNNNVRDDEYYWRAEHGQLRGYGPYWCENGSFYRTGKQHGNDLVAEWVDEPAAATAPKFKVGDRVENAIPGNDYDTPGTVTEIVGDTYRVRWDDEGWLDSSLEWNDDELRLVADTPTTLGDILAAAVARQAIVCRIDNGQPRPSTSPYVHADRAAAAKEAARLAKANPGKEFGVYEFVSSAKEERVYDHEWQRAAKDGREYDAACLLQDIAGTSFHGAQAAVTHWLSVAA